ncbi:MAG: type II toxin-antitoxin system PemK/MazF family toxin [Clostridia bacterium]|nr:type II toxin-antitoxin system PemK/MazF family toxin [Clostridia bacterium]
MIKNSIVLVPFPFDDLSGVKPRPALCLTNEIGKYHQIIRAFISSNLSHTLLSSDILIEKNSSNWNGTGLAVDSILRVHKIVTIPKILLKRKLGVINSELQQEVYLKLKTLFEN